MKANAHFRRPTSGTYTAAERGRTTVLIGGLPWPYLRLVAGVLEGLGHRCDVLPTPDATAFQLGKDNCNNGECNPVYFMVGSLIQYLKARQAEGLTPSQIVERYVHFTVGSCGPCRHGMYEAEYRFALRNAGFEGFRIPLFVQSRGLFGQGEEPGLDFSFDFAVAGFQALMLGDLLTDLLHQVRPFEIEPGAADRWLERSVERLALVMRQRRLTEPNEWRVAGWLPRAAAGAPFRLGVRAAVKLLDAFGEGALAAEIESVRAELFDMELDRSRLRPVVKIVGEFYSQTTEGPGNYDMFRFLEREGAEVVTEPIATWVTYLLHQALTHWRFRRGLEVPFPGAGWLAPFKRLRNWWHFRRWEWAFAATEWLYGRLYASLSARLGGLAHTLAPHAEISRLAHPFYNTLIRGGEGHQEVGKNIYYSTHGLAHMVLSLKPFGCMPSQLSDGVQSAVASRHPDMVFVPVETSGDGEVHAQSRVQMALAEARTRARKEREDAYRSCGIPRKTLESYVAVHPELARLGTAGIARTLGLEAGASVRCAALATRFVLHVASLARREERSRARLGVRREETAASAAPVAPRVCRS